MKLHILIFDDDADIRNLLQTALSTKGDEVVALASPADFPFINHEKCTCDAENPCADVLLADIVMPDVDGIDLIKKLKQLGCYPLSIGNVAVMSGYLTLHYMEDLNQLGVQYFRKPLAIKEIQNWVEECRSRIEYRKRTAVTNEP
jgi:DNA-binding NtrC family response regulator